MSDLTPMRANLVGLADVMPRAQLARTIADGVCVVRLTCADPSRLVEFTLTRDEIDEINAELGMTGATICTGIVVHDADEIDDVPGSRILGG